MGTIKSDWSIEKCFERLRFQNKKGTQIVLTYDVQQQICQLINVFYMKVPKEKEILEQKQVCSNCGSSDIEAKAWVKLNDKSKTDFSASESGDPDDFWCPDCETHSKPTSLIKYFENNFKDLYER